ncbi:MAG: hypothetical protein AAF039_08140, partial [Bacteroidota bacterium]
MASKKLSKKLKQRSKKQKHQAEDTAVPTLSRKEQRAKERAAAKLRSQLIQFTIVSFVLSSVVGLLVGLLVEPTLGVAATGALLCLVLSFKYQREAFYAFIIYIPFSGTVTYMLGGNSLLQLAKDAIYVPALIGVVQFCQKKRLPILLPEAIKVPLVLVLTMVLLNLLLVNLPQQFD